MKLRAPQVHHDSSVPESCSVAKLNNRRPRRHFQARRALKVAIWNFFFTLSPMKITLIIYMFLNFPIGLTSRIQSCLCFKIYNHYKSSPLPRQNLREYVSILTKIFIWIFHAQAAYTDAIFSSFISLLHREGTHQHSPFLPPSGNLNFALFFSISHLLRGDGIVGKLAQNKKDGCMYAFSIFYQKDMDG